MPGLKRVCELYILWNDGSSLVVNNVTEYGCVDNNGGGNTPSYYFRSNSVLNFVPMNNVKFFGDKEFWDNSHYKGD